MEKNRGKTSVKGTALPGLPSNQNSYIAVKSAGPVYTKPGNPNPYMNMTPPNSLHGTSGVRSLALSPSLGYTPYLPSKLLYGDSSVRSFAPSPSSIPGYIPFRPQKNNYSHFLPIEYKRNEHTYESVTNEPIYANPNNNTLYNQMGPANSTQLKQKQFRRKPNLIYNSTNPIPIYNTINPQKPLSGLAKNKKFFYKKKKKFTTTCTTKKPGFTIEFISEFKHW